MSLLDQARKLEKISTRQHSSTISVEKCELALAWMKREISSDQVASVLGCRYDAVHHRMAAFFLAGLRAGLVEADLKSELRAARDRAKRGGGAGA